MVEVSLRRAMNVRRILPEPLLDRLYAVSRRVAYADGQLIHGRGDATQALLLVDSGRVRAGNAGADGSFVTAYVFDPGDAIGEFTIFAGLPHTHDFVAVGPTVIRYIDKGSFHRLRRQEPELAFHFLQAITLRLHFAIEMLDDTIRLPLVVRTAKLLRHGSTLSSDPGVIEVRQVEIADALGVSRVAIGKTLKKLRSERLIEQRRGRIHIPDRRRLDRWISARSPVPEL